MNDDVKAAIEWLQRSIQELEAAVFRNRDLGTSTQYELDDASKHLDGEPARQAAAVAAAREESALTGCVYGASNCFVETPIDEPCAGCAARKALADRIAELEATLNMGVREWNDERTMLVAERRRANVLEAERDALRAQVEAARAWAERNAVTDLRNAMDEAKP